jgi:N-glycosidase YbiA
MLLLNDADNPVIIRKVAEPFGWMGNMSPHPVEHGGKRWRTTEALFQAMRFSDETVIEAIRAEKSPMAAKMKAKSFSELRTTTPLSEADLDNMRTCLRLKLDTHSHLEQELLLTEDRPIVEDCTRRKQGAGLFWGAALWPGGTWVGDNWLGRMWMEIRDARRSA